MARLVACDIEDGAHANLGIGQPMLVANCIPEDKEVVLHSGNGILGMGPAPAAGDEDFDLINAGKQPVTLPDSGAFFHHADSFATLRGGHTACACWAPARWRSTATLRTGARVAPHAIPAVGGAMDLATGARQTWVVMDLLTREDQSKLVHQCSHPLTGLGCVKRIYSDLCVLRLGGKRPVGSDLVEGLTVERL